MNENRLATSDEHSRFSAMLRTAWLTAHSRNSPSQRENIAKMEAMKAMKAEIERKRKMMVEKELVVRRIS